MRKNESSLPTAFLFLVLILLAGGVTACGSPAPQAAPATETATPLPPTPTSTPTPVLSLGELAARVCQRQGFPDAAEYAARPGAEHKIFLIDARGSPHPWLQDLPERLIARSTAELEAVLCLEDQQAVKSASCGQYTDQFFGEMRELREGYYTLNLKLVAAKTGELLALDTIRSASQGCPDHISGDDPHFRDWAYYGDDITWKTVWKSWRDIPQAIINPTATQTPTRTPTAPPTPALKPAPSVENWELIVYDDFSDQDYGWDPGPGQTIANGVLTVQFSPNESGYLSQSNLRSRFTFNVYARLAARHTGGSPADAYGLAFRMEDETEQLAFLISDDGVFRLQSSISGSPILEKPSLYIRPGEWNILEIIDLEGAVYLFINGMQVAQLYVEEPYYGQVGWAASAVENPDSTAGKTFEFDEIEVREP